MKGLFWPLSVIIVLSWGLGVFTGYALNIIMSDPPRDLSSTTYCRQYAGPGDRVGFPRKCKLEAVVVTEGKRKHVEIYIDRDEVEHGELDGINAYWLPGIGAMP